MEDNPTSPQSLVIPEERDLHKLKLASVHNLLSVPVLDRQNTTPIGVLSLYNYTPSLYSEATLWALSSLLSGILFRSELLQGVLINLDILEAQFNLVNDAVIILNTTSTVSKVNKSAEIMMGGQTSDIMIGKHITEVLGPRNGHLFQTFKE